MDKKELKKRTKNFAHNCVKMALSLPKTPIEKHITHHLVRCSTSVAANYRATCLAQSKASFIAKLSLVLEEVDESAFWLEFILDEDLMSEEKVTHLLYEADELTSIFFASRKTAREKMKIDG